MPSSNNLGASPERMRGPAHKIKADEGEALSYFCKEIIIGGKRGSLAY